MSTKIDNYSREESISFKNRPNDVNFSLNAQYYWHEKAKIPYTTTNDKVIYYAKQNKKFNLWTATIQSKLFMIGYRLPQRNDTQIALKQLPINLVSYKKWKPKSDQSHS